MHALQKGFPVLTSEFATRIAFWLPQFHTFPHHWRMSLAKHSSMIFINVLENLISVRMQSRHWDFTVFHDAEEAVK